MAFLNAFKGQSHAAFRIVLGLLFFVPWHPEAVRVSHRVHLRNEPHADGRWSHRVGGRGDGNGGFLLTVRGFYIASGTMAVAYWMAHGMNGLFPIANGGELAAIYCFGFSFSCCKWAGNVEYQ